MVTEGGALIQSVGLWPDATISKDEAYRAVREQETRANGTNRVHVVVLRRASELPPRGRMS